MPDEFAKLPGKTIYVSLGKSDHQNLMICRLVFNNLFLNSRNSFSGSMFSIYVDKLQRLVDILDKIPNAKFIVSKGPNGDKLRLPNNRFIGENYVDQVGLNHDSI